MDRVIVYPSAIPLDTDILQPQRNEMVSLGWLLQSVMGTETGAVGLTCTPTNPASLTVNIGPGAIWAKSEVDANSFGSLAADSSPLMKMGIAAEAAGTDFTLAAPGTAGQSINYLIEASFEEADTDPVVLPYVNAANPSQPFSGPNNSGAAQNKVRAQKVALQLKAGAAATAGTQVTPAVDVGWIGLYVVTVNYGQSAITSTSIAQYAGNAFRGPSLLEVIQSGATNFAVDSSPTANAVILAFRPALTNTTRLTGTRIAFQAANSNTGATSLTDGVSTCTLYANGAAMVGGEIVGGAHYVAEYAGNNQYNLIAQSAGEVAVSAATHATHAVNLGQLFETLWPTANETINPTAFFTVVLPSESSGGLTLPLNKGTTPGQRVFIYGTNSGPVTIATVDNTFNIQSPSVMQNSYTLPSVYGCYVEFLWDGLDYRYQSGSQPEIRPAVQSYQPPTLGQVQTALNGVAAFSMPRPGDLNAAGLGWSSWNAGDGNIPVAGSYGIAWTVSQTGSATPSASNWLTQIAWTTAGLQFVRQNVDNAGWGAWSQVATTADLQASQAVQATYYNAINYTANSVTNITTSVTFTAPATGKLEVIATADYYSGSTDLSVSATNGTVGFFQASRSPASAGGAGAGVGIVSVTAGQSVTIQASASQASGGPMNVALYAKYI
ncbi:hypothetical protein [Acidocella aminolytica]|uniref:Tail fiber protein n=1 Tax=Acidocella aminolytica 101 = DSM 11237 TaxID=1120923 RepID=A0A0D6PF51_9PROT|nr:hypothetical protein [Acidocella aminolytica]GAN79833.1 hypothetical protein Aam_030_066 [Acidocella aminolytica 101 = DSM 11237]GBQ31981.1 hypothetical protein AA11237_0032 [Acidocella aminolytica 101 = DSM 11237]SHF36027.1 hypothetical protein SAMN02746095_02968 [Acidocella aminolytica 101 = DSM 11237]